MRMEARSRKSSSSALHGLEELAEFLKKEDVRISS
jgi:hypothetical protein